MNLRDGGGHGARRDAATGSELSPHETSVAVLEPTENEVADDRKDGWVHLRLKPADAAELDRVVRWMATQRELTRLVGNQKGRPMALRYAVGQLVSMLPDEEPTE